jgi:hypothetical protein
MLGESVDGNTICEKIKSVFDDLKRESYQSSGSVFEDFRASKGWFESFKHRSDIYSVVRHGEAASGDAEAAETFKAEFSALIEEESYFPQQEFNVDETGLWNKMSRRTSIIKDENALPGHKLQKIGLPFSLGLMLQEISN